MKIIKVSQNIPNVPNTPPSSDPEYMIENGILYDENGDDVFSMKELIKHKVPLFRSPQAANEFLAQLELVTKRKFGRVPEKDYLHDIRYKDTRKEREKAKLDELDQRNEKWQRGELYR